MMFERTASGGATWPERAKRARSRRIIPAQLAVLLFLPGIAFAQARHAPKPPPVDLEPQVAALAADLHGAREDLAALRMDFGGLGSRLDEAQATSGANKGIAEPMREEVRGLYVETSNVRSEIARLAETYAANTEALAKSRYVLTLLLVATVALQLIILAVLMRR